MTLALAGCASHVESGSRVEQPLPTPLPSGPVFAGAPPAKMMLERTALGVSPDGVLRYIVRAKFADRSGAPTVLLGGGDVAFDASNARVQWQTRMRFGGAAAIVSFERDVPGIVRVGADVGRPVAPQTITIDPRTWRGAPGLVAALGPHLVVAGWFPPSARGTVRVLRASARKGAARVVGLVAAPGTTFRDTSVRPGAVYRYDVLVPGRARYSQRVTVPAESRGARLGALAGKAIWLSFSPSPLDADAYARLDPREIVARARASGLRAIELRVAYGAFDESTGGARTFVDALLDAAAPAGIAIFAWTVPRSTAFEDLATAVAATRFQTARGHTFAGLAVDLERGSEFLGDGPDGYAALTDYLPRLRAALGGAYPIVATVEDPYLEHLDERDFPYAEIAASADALQPMTYWRMLSNRATTPEAVRATLRASYAATQRAAGRRIPIDVGGQASVEGKRGAPPAAEIEAAVSEAKALGALGITFFDWNGTNDAQWRALAETRW